MPHLEASDDEGCDLVGEREEVEGRRVGGGRLEGEGKLAEEEVEVGALVLRDGLERASHHSDQHVEEDDGGEGDKEEGEQPIKDRPVLQGA